MTWLELRNWALLEDKRLRDEGYWDSAEWTHVDYLENWLKSRERVADKCVEHFLETGEWGELARDDRLALYYRISWATQILALLTHPDANDRVIVPDPTPDADAVRKWVLMDMWKLFGRRTVVAFLRR